MKKPSFKLNRTLTVSLISVFLGLLFGAVLMLFTGANPFEAYNYLFVGGFGSLERIANTLSSATVLTFTGLAVTFAFRTGLFNIGAAGQMLMGGLFATAFAHLAQLPAPLLVLGVILSGIAGGAIMGAIAGFLKAKFNVHEVVATIMLNWTAYWIVYFVIPKYFKGDYYEIFSKNIPIEASLRMPWLTALTGSEYINGGLFIAIGCVLLVTFILNRTVLGYELKAVGLNRFGAENVGINVNRNIVVSMSISGALAGLAGVAYHAGYALNMQIGVMPTQGFDGIAVSLLGASTPIGVFLSSIFFGALQTGKGFMNAMIDIPPDIADIIIAVIIYFAATSILINNWLDKLQKRRSNKKGGDK